MRNGMIFAIVATLAASPAFAGDADVAAQHGLLGAWAYDCKLPPGDTNPYEVYSRATDGSVTRVLTMNVPGLDGPSRLTEFQDVGGKLRSKWVRQSDGSITIVTQDVDGQHSRSWHSETPEGKVYVDQAKFTSSNSPVHWFEKCGTK